MRILAFLSAKRYIAHLPWQNIKLWCQEKHHKNEKNNLTARENIFDFNIFMLYVSHSSFTTEK